LSKEIDKRKDQLQIQIQIQISQILKIKFGNYWTFFSFVLGTTDL